jgi:carbon starvation protein CstA
LNAPAQGSSSSAARLVTIKVIHTIVWVFFVACILAIWVFALRDDYVHAALSIGVVLVEVLVLVLNGWQCPLTSVAARYTDERRDNFDIYLPEWLARHNKLIFGTLYVAGIAATLARWSNASR